MSSILHSTSPPPFWIWVGAASLLVMVILWVARSLAHRRQRVFDSAREGVMGLDGVIAFDNLPSVRLLSEPPPGTIPSGPVVVLFGTAPGPGPLPPLATVSASAVVPGKLSEHREMGAFRVFCRDAGILGVAFLGGAPLAVAIVRSLF